MRLIRKMTAEVKTSKIQVEIDHFLIYRKSKVGLFIFLNIFIFNRTPIPNFSSRYSLSKNKEKVDFCSLTIFWPFCYFTKFFKKNRKTIFLFSGGFDKFSFCSKNVQEYRNGSKIVIPSNFNLWLKNSFWKIFTQKFLFKNFHSKIIFLNFDSIIIVLYLDGKIIFHISNWPNLNELLEVKI